MKAFILALIVIGAIATPEMNSLWESWKTQYNVQYDNSVEESVRFAVFSNNYAAIQEWNARSDVTSKMALNKFANLTNEEFGAMYTGAFPAQDSEVVYESFEGDNSCGSSFDWRDKNMVTEVKNQEQCGSCWAFATVASIESLYLINGNSQKLFSEQQVVDCSTANYGCNGGWPYKAFQYTQTKGLETESDYPYTAQTGSCKYDASDATMNLNSGYFMVQSLNNAQNLKNAICQQPVAVIVEADQNAFQFYSGGVVSSGCGVSLDHAITAVGYGTKEKDTDSFYVKNSWGADWGVDGYIYISTDDSTNHGAGVCGILSQPQGPKSPSQ